MEELVHGVVEGLGDKAITGSVGVLGDLLGESDLFFPGLGRGVRIKAGFLEQVLVPEQGLGRERHRNAPLGAVEGDGIGHVVVVGGLFLVGHRHRNDQVVLGELLEGTRADIGQGDRGAGSGQRGHLVLALAPAHDLGHDLVAGIGSFPLGEVVGIAGGQFVTAVDEGDFLVLGKSRRGSAGQSQHGHGHQTDCLFHLVVSLDCGPLGPFRRPPGVCLKRRDDLQTRCLLLFHGTGGETGDEVALQEHDDDHDRQDADEGRRHQLVPDHFLLAEEGEQPDRQRHELGL